MKQQKTLTNTIAIVPNLIVKDDVGLLYRVVDILPHSMVVEPFPNDDNFAAEIISYNSYINEKWQIVGNAM